MTLTLHDICHVENTLEPILSSDKMVRTEEPQCQCDISIPDVTGWKEKCQEL